MLDYALCYVRIVTGCYSTVSKHACGGVTCIHNVFYPQHNSSISCCRSTHHKHVYTTGHTPQRTRTCSTPTLRISHQLGRPDMVELKSQRTQRITTHQQYLSYNPIVQCSRKIKNKSPRKRGLSWWLRPASIR